MATASKPHLISFKICPFVQRSVITLREKQVEHDVTYIDLANKPDWFLKVSPLGKVPVLQVGDESLFESAVINEYLDETNGESYHPTDPLIKAKNRAWIEYISQILMDQYRNAIAGDEAEFHKHLDASREKLERLETVHTGPYFNGADFSLVDAAIAPAFTRFAVLDEALQAIDPKHALNLYAKAPKVGEWARLLIERQSVQDSVVPEFAELYLGYIKENGKYAGGLLGG